MSDTSITSAWREALDCVDILLSRPESAREQYLRELLVSRPELHARVQSLLNADRPASHVEFPGALEFKASNVDIGALCVDATLGPYRIVRELGKGGMGEVWLARRDDGLYQGEVAIKTLHPYFAGSAQRDRFLREATLLGRLTHPNIARLFDAGISDGVVYLVLEYVRGEPIDVWCDARSLSVDARLKVFADVCAAVTHAHANLIVHRDIKPSNILVTDDGQVKLLDFGIGKLVENETTKEQTELTRITGRVFTPEYAAPEQILGETITTATDVYSLGVLLHMLLSGTRPYAGTSNEIDLERAVLHDDPISMSRAVSMLSMEEIAIARSTTLVRLQRELSGDLNHMVARAMRKTPGERYGSVLAFVADIERYLNHQPVEARAGSNAYRFNRFVRRHRAGAFAVAVSVTALIFGSGIALWQAKNARQQARLATVEAGKATAVKDFLLDIFNANSERHPDGARARQTTAEELLDVASQKIMSNPEQDPEVRAELMATLGNLNVLLEKRELGETLQRERVKFITERFGANDTRLVEALLDLSGVLRQRDKVDEALAVIEQAIDILGRTGMNDSMLRGRAELEAAHTLYSGRGGTGSNLIGRYQLAVDILEKFPPSESLEQALLGLARAYELARQFDDAIAMSGRALALAVNMRSEKSAVVAGGHQLLARVLAQKQRFAEAQANNAKAIEIYTFLVGPKHTATMTARMDLGNLLMLQGKYRDAALELEGVVATLIEIDGDADTTVQTARYMLATALHAIGAWERARSLLDAAIQNVAKLQNQNSLAGMLRIRAALALDENRPRDALADIERSWEVVQKGRGPRSLRAATIQTTHGEALVVLGRVDEGRAILDQSLALLNEVELDPARPDGLSAQLALVKADLEQHRFDAAQAASAAVFDKLSALERRKELWVLEETADRRLADAMIASGKPQSACVQLAAAIALRESNALPTDPRLTKSRELQKKFCR